MKTHIRLARDQDAKTLCDAEKYWAERPGHLISVPDELKTESFAHRIKELDRNPKGLYVVIESDVGKVMGHALLDPMGLERISHIVRLTIVVHPSFEGKGLGRLLMDYAIAWAKETKDIEKIELLVRATNERAIALYQSFGFIEEGRLRKRLRLGGGNYIDDITMGLMVK